jgi:UDP-N-acetylglucosamine 3-dehydrogenase
MKVGVIGAGYWGKKHVAEYLAIPGTEVVVSDLLPENRKACEEKFKVKTVADYHEILKDRKILAVSICTPNETHYEICKEALKKGKHVLLEKPMTLSSKEAVKLVSLAEKKGRLLAVGHIFRFNNGVAKAREMVATGDLGEVYLVELTWTNLEPIFPGRDILFDLAPHPFDIVNNVFGRNPDWVFCIGSTCRKEAGEEAAFVHAKIGKTLVNLNLSWVTPKKVRRLAIVGSKKSIFVDCLSQQIEEYDVATKAAVAVPIVANNTIGDELSQFLSCIEKGTISASDGKLGAQIVSVIEDSVASLKKGKPVTVRNLFG